MVNIVLSFPESFAQPIENIHVYKVENDEAPTFFICTEIINSRKHITSAIFNFSQIIVSHFQLI